MLFPVDLGTFDHQEEALLIMRKDFDGQFGSFRQEVSPAIGH